MKLQGQFEGLGRGTISLFLSQRAVSHRLRVRDAVLGCGGTGTLRGHRDEGVAILVLTAFGLRKAASGGECVQHACPAPASGAVGRQGPVYTLLPVHSGPLGIVGLRSPSAERLFII